MTSHPQLCGPYLSVIVAIGVYYVAIHIKLLRTMVMITQIVRKEKQCTFAIMPDVQDIVFSLYVSA